MENQDHHTDVLFMRRALALASQGHGLVSPNPLVGCVIVHQNKIVGEGWHKKYGEAHAEVNAVNAVADKSILKECTVYVNLEPCSHIGKTPPCADMLIQHNVKKVVVANVDPNPVVAGSGIKKLKAAGIEVVTGVLEDEGYELNRRFFIYMEMGRPCIILKWAETADGFIARDNYDSKWISNQHSRQLVHKWRSEEDAVLVGKRTAEHDNPILNVRDWTGRNPVRIVLDRNLALDKKLNIFDHSQKTICYNLLKDDEQPNLVWVKLKELNFIQNLVNNLYKQKIQSVIVEGGCQTLQSFIDAQLWDEARVFVSDQSFEKGIPAPGLYGELVREEKILNDTLKWFRPIHK